ncbi:MAG TPA: hypothetical protein VM737_05060 [Gemmatimonadota bacterium]|nr:hypothetical protein [Gemmatimonadota bacterium]
MAILNVKSLPDALYRKLKARAKRNHRSLAQEVTHILSESVGQAESLSILELQGLGKEHWKEVDGADHVEAERRSWS